MPEAGEQETPLRGLAARYFRLIGFDTEFAPDGLLRVSEPSGSALAFRFVPAVDDAELRDQGVQYLGAGSQPLERIMTDLRQRSRTAVVYCRRPFKERELQNEWRALEQARCPEVRVTFHSTHTEFVPTLVAAFKAAYTTDEKVEELRTMGVNMSTAALLEDYWPDLFAMPMSATSPLEGVMRRRLSVRKAYALMVGAMCTRFAAADTGWITKASERLAAEMATLRQYYAAEAGGTAPAPDAADLPALAGEGSITQSPSEFERKVAEETARFRPRVVVGLVGIVLAYVPHFITTADGRTGDGELAWSRGLDVDGATGALTVTPSDSAAPWLGPPSLCETPAPVIPQAEALWQPV